MINEWSVSRLIYSVAGSGSIRNNYSWRTSLTSRHIHLWSYDSLTHVLFPGNWSLCTWWVSVGSYWGTAPLLFMKLQTFWWILQERSHIQFVNRQMLIDLREEPSFHSGKWWWEMMPSEKEKAKVKGKGPPFSTLMSFWWFYMKVFISQKCWKSLWIFF